MRVVLILSLFLSIGLIASAQKISYDPPPNLPKPISATDYKFIVDSSVAIISTHYKVDHVEAGAIHVLDEHKNPGQLNLDNLILQCLDENREDWISTIHEHFEKLFVSLEAQRALDPKKYETVKKFLSLRIYPRETVDSRGGTAPLLARTDLEGTYTLVMLDLPGAFTPVQRRMFDLWHVDTAEVFRIAQANVDSEKVEKVTKTFEMEKGIKVEISMLGEENYAASYALDLMHNSPELLGEWGCAIAIPNKGLVSTCKISKEAPIDFVKFIQYSQPFIEKSYREHPQPISDQFFWYYKGKFTLIETRVDDKGHLNVLAPAGLAELMTEKP